MRDRHSILLWSALLVSGAAGLIYQVVWMRLLLLFLGVTSQAVSTVLATFMAGLCLGSWLLARRADKVESPLKFYAYLEIGIAVFGVLSVPLLGLLQSVYVSLVRELALSQLLSLIHI